MKIAYQEFKSPLAVHLEITSACNHKCVHCYNYWREAGEAVGTIRRNDLNRIIDNLIKCDVQDLVITGGEPLLFSEIVYEAIDLAHKGNIRCFLNTNLSLMTEEIAAKIRERCVPILTSFPSYEEGTFDRIVNKEGAYEEVLRGIEIALSYGIHLTANMVVMQYNKDQIVQTGRFLHSRGITSLTATKVHPSQSCKDFAPLQLKPEEVVSVFDALLTLRDELGVTIGTLTCYPMCLFKDMKRYGDILLQKSCTAGKTAGAIGADGGVRPCTHSDEVFGNAITESLYDIWPRMMEWRNGTFIPDACQKCKWVKKCGAGCRMDSKFFNGRIDQPDPYMVENCVPEIVMPESLPLPFLDDHLPLFVNSHISYREEDFGTYINSGSYVRLVTKDSADLLRSLSKGIFNLREIVQNYNLDIETTRQFFAALIKEEFVVFEQSEDDALVSPFC